MPSDKNRNKVYTILVLCIGIVISVWLFQRKPESISLVKQNTNTVSANPYRDVIPNTNEDWKKMLTSIDPKNQVITSVIKNNSNTFDETTLTAQMARDFFSQYLLAKKGGQALTPDQINKIVQNTLASPQYTKTSQIVYLTSNLHINPNTDPSTVKKYRDVLNLSLKNRSTQVKDNPMILLNMATKTGGSDILARLDSIITTGHNMVNDLLSMEVPSDAVQVHLNLLNVSANIVLSLESMRQIYTDPVKSLVGISSYSQELSKLEPALSDVNAYFVKKLGSAQ